MKTQTVRRMKVNWSNMQEQNHIADGKKGQSRLLLLNLI